MFGATSIEKNNSKQKYVHRGYGIAFDVKGESSFDNNYARNVLSFGVDNSSSSYADNLRNDYAVLDEGNTFCINGTFGLHQMKKFSINFSKAKQNFA